MEKGKRGWRGKSERVTGPGNGNREKGKVRGKETGERGKKKEEGEGKEVKGKVNVPVPSRFKEGINQ